MPITRIVYIIIETADTDYETDSEADYLRMKNLKSEMINETFR